MVHPHTVHRPLGALLISCTACGAGVIGGNHPLVLHERGKNLGKMGRIDELSALIQRAAGGGPRTMHVVSELRTCLKEAQAAAAKANAAASDMGAEGQPATPPPRRIDGYALWTLAAVTPVSRHSAVYHFTSSDRKRGTPYTRGRGRTMWHRTWHTTLLAQVGRNAEGPLPWVERDYTPVSTWREWEKGTCDILIKVYREGAATSWLHKQPLGTRLWLSTPKKTLSVPSLVADPSSMSNKFKQHRAVLLVLGGTGQAHTQCTPHPVHLPSVHC